VTGDADVNSSLEVKLSQAGELIYIFDRHGMVLTVASFANFILGSLVLQFLDMDMHWIQLDIHEDRRAAKRQ